MGVLFVTPLLLTWIGARQKEPAEGGTLELAALSATLLASSSISFLSNFPLRFSVYPFIIWTALRFRQREMTAAIAVVSGLAIWATSHGLGPWASGSLDSRLIQVDSWMSVLAITCLLYTSALWHDLRGRCGKHGLHLRNDDLGRREDTLQF